MAAKSSDWQPGPTVCRCCLTEGCYKDISTEYFWMGKREVYSEMLSETFDVTISYALSMGTNSNSRLICEPCISRLRDASDFKRQVLDCERTFLQYLVPQSSSAGEGTTATDQDIKVSSVKLEVKFSDDEEIDTSAPFQDDDDDLDDEPLTKLASKIPKKESVDYLELEDNAKPVKRKSTIKIKASPSKKAKKTKETVKATASKAAATAKPEKKKKGRCKQTEKHNMIILEAEETASVEIGVVKRRYQRSARAEARLNTKNNASSILECWTICPFRWKRNRFKCAYCEANFTDCEPLREHVKMCSTHCTVTDIYSKFKEMSLINVDLTDASCRLCAAPLTDVAQMRDHVIHHGYKFDLNHPDGVIPFCLDKDSWRCVICQERFNNFLKLYEHMNVHYQHYICAICGKGYMTAPRLRKHSEVHVTGSFPCKECGRIFNMRAARDYHKAHAHAKAPRYECPQCNMRFDGYYDRMNHLNEAHREKEVLYSCTHCELSFKTSGKRAIHVRTVHFPPQRDFQCRYCEWQFRTGYELKRHMVKHTGERNFHCTVCGKSYPRNRALKTHLKTHEDLKQRQMFPQIRVNLPDLADLLPVSDKI